MKRHILLILALFITVCSGCRHQSAEETPYWFEKYRFFKYNEYKNVLAQNVDKLTDNKITFSAQIKDYYQKQDKPFWTANGFQEDYIKELTGIIARADEHGISPDVFGYTTINRLIDTLKNGDVNRAEDLYALLSQLEFLLTDAYVQYVKDLSFGATNPVEANGGKWLFQTIYPDEAFIVQTLDHLDGFSAYLQSVQPTDKDYVKMQAELKKFLAIGDTVLPKIPYISAKCSQEANNVNLVGERLRFLNLLPAGYLPDNRLDKTCMEAVNHFRRIHGIPACDSLSRETIDMLNMQPKYYIQKISTNLERMRWKTAHVKSENYVAVNTADFHLTSKCADTIATDMKICCGKYPKKRRSDEYDAKELLTALESESPLLYSEINMIVLNPEWNVPEKIFSNEYYPKFLKNPAYIQKHHYFLIDLKTKEEILPETINWHKIRKKNIPYKLVQSSGKWNALGKIKFNFANTESVYLHDTDVPSAFKRRNRALSHGCIRIEKPRELMRLLLVMNDYDTVKLEQTYIILGDEPTTEKGEDFLEEQEEKEKEYFENLDPEDTIFYRPLRPTHLFLKKRMPLFIEYFTCFIDNNDEINYRPDLYEKEGNIMYLLRQLEH